MISLIPVIDPTDQARAFTQMTLLDIADTLAAIHQSYNPEKAHA